MDERSEQPEREHAAPGTHPEFQKALVQQGEDAGRLRDKDLAHDIANEIDDRGFQDNPEAQDNITKRHVIGKVVAKESENLLDRINTAATHPDQEIFRPGPNYDAQEVDRIQEVADSAVRSYDQLRDDAKLEREADARKALEDAESD